jgi:hypothetical protein
MNRTVLLLFAGLLILNCGPHPRQKSIDQDADTRKDRHQEVILVLSPYLNQYSYDTLGSVEVKLKRRKSDKEKSLAELLTGLPPPGDNPWLTTTEEMLTKLLKQARSLGANAITNLELGSYDRYGYLHTEEIAGHEHVVFAKAMALYLDGFTGLPPPSTIVKDRSYVRVQSTNYPIEKNVIVILSPFLKRSNHEKKGEVVVTLEGREQVQTTPTEEIIKRLMYEAALKGANAISELEIGSFEEVQYLHQQDKVNRIHIVYGRAQAAKIFPKDKK